MTHSFDIAVAKEYGINAAILLRHIYFWCEKNRANDVNYRDGLYWTYNSRKAFAELFPYLSEKQIKSALDRLIDNGLIVTGVYNDDVWNRTLWYAVTKRGECICQNGKMDDDKMSNAYAEDGKSYYTDIKHTDVNADNIYEDDDNNACARVRESDTPETAPNAYGDADDGKPIAGTAEQYAIDNLRVMTPGNLQECGEFIDKHGVSADVMKYAIDVACGNGSPVWNYVASILYQWLDAGVKTVGDAKQQRENRRRKKDTVTPQNAGRVVPAQRKTAAEESAEFWANVPRY